MTEIARQMGIRVRLDGLPVDIDTANVFYALINLKVWLHSYPAAKKLHPILTKAEA